MFMARCAFTQPLAAPLLLDFQKFCACLKVFIFLENSKCLSKDVVFSVFWLHILLKRRDFCIELFFFLNLTFKSLINTTIKFYVQFFKRHLKLFLSSASMQK